MILQVGMTSFSPMHGYGRIEESNVVYAITCQETGMVYVGSTVHGFKKRSRRHLRDLQLKKHANPHLQNAWNHYGEDAFKFEVLEVTERDNVREREQHWLDFYNEKGKTYNCGTVIGKVMLGRTWTVSKETRRKISEKLQGHKMPDHVKEALQQANVGRPISEETIQKRLATLRKRNWVMPPEGCQAISHAKMGHPVSEETRRKLSEIFQDNPSNVASYPSFYNEQTREVIPAGENLAALCRARGLSYPSMQLVKREVMLEHRDWRKVGARQEMPRGQPYPAFQNRETGEIIPAGVNLVKLCREKGLRAGHMNSVKNGKRKSCQGWMLAEEIA